MESNKDFENKKQIKCKNQQKQTENAPGLWRTKENTQMPSTFENDGKKKQEEAVVFQCAPYIKLLSFEMDAQMEWHIAKKKFKTKQEVEGRTVCSKDGKQPDSQAD